MRGHPLDTHVWFWYLAGSERLPQALRQRIDELTGDWWLSAVSVWELGLLARRGRVEISGSFRAWVGAAFERLPLREAPLTREITLRSLEIDLGHPDPADHVLAATALTHELTLLTVDSRLTGREWLPAFSGSGPTPSPAQEPKPSPRFGRAERGEAFSRTGRRGGLSVRSRGRWVRHPGREARPFRLSSVPPLQLGGRHSRT